MRWIVLLLLAGCGGAVEPKEAKQWVNDDLSVLLARQAAQPGICLLTTDGWPFCIPAPGETSCHCTEPPGWK